MSGIKPDLQQTDSPPVSELRLDLLVEAHVINRARPTLDLKRVVLTA
jgi:hypothetical protein